MAREKLPEGERSCRCKKRPPDKRRGLGTGTGSLPNPGPQERMERLNTPTSLSFIPLYLLQRLPIGPTQLESQRQGGSVDANHPGQPSRAEVSVEGWAGRVSRNIQHNDLLFLPCS